MASATMPSRALVMHLARSCGLSLSFSSQLALALSKASELWKFKTQALSGADSTSCALGPSGLAGSGSGFGSGFGASAGFSAAGASAGLEPPPQAASDVESAMRLRQRETMA